MKATYNDSAQSISIKTVEFFFSSQKSPLKHYRLLDIECTSQITVCRIKWEKKHLICSCSCKNWHSFGQSVFPGFTFYTCIQRSRWNMCCWTSLCHAHVCVYQYECFGFRSFSQTVVDPCFSSLITRRWNERMYMLSAQKNTVIGLLCHCLNKEWQYHPQSSL